MQPGYFKKLTRFENYIAVFRLVGYSAWNGEAAGSSPACYTRFVSVTVTSQIFDLSPRVTPRYKPQIVGCCTGSTPGSDPGGVGSNPAPITNVDASLTGKAFRCERKEQGSSPGVNPFTGKLEAVQFGS